MKSENEKQSSESLLARQALCKVCAVGIHPGALREIWVSELLKARMQVPRRYANTVEDVGLQDRASKGCLHESHFRIRWVFGVHGPRILCTII